MDFQDGDMPVDADKLLFAEDFVSYVMTDVFNRPYEGSWVTPYRPFIHNAFNETLKVILIDLISRSQGLNSFYYSMVDDIREPNEHRYWEIVRDLQGRYSSEGFDVKLFLLYCIDITITALIFKNNGLESAPDTAVSAIYEFIKDYDMMSTGWSTLNVLVSYMASIHAAKAEILTPESMSPPSSESGHDQDLSNCSSLQGKGSVLQSKEDDKIAEGEDMNGIQRSEPVSKDALTVDTKVCAENLELSCLSKWKDLLLPSDILEVARGGMKSTEENEATHSKGNLLVTEGIEVDNLQMPSASTEHKTLQSVSAFEGDPNKSGTTSASDLENKGTSISNEKMDTLTCLKSLVFKEDKEHLVDTSGEYEKLKLSEESCMLLIPKKSPVSQRLSQLPGPSSESDLQDGKGRNRSK